MRVQTVGSIRRTDDVNIMQAFMDRHALYAGDAQQIEKIEEFARWAMEQDVIIYDVDAGEIVGAEDAPWAKVGARVVASALNIEEEFVQCVAHRLATWDAWGWNVHTLDIKDGWARWKSFYGTSYSARLLPGENYLNLPLHNHESRISDLPLAEKVQPIFVKKARQRIEDMREYL
jgi:hypothetical protein